MQILGGLGINKWRSTDDPSHVLRGTAASNLICSVGILTAAILSRYPTGDGSLSYSEDMVTGLVPMLMGAYLWVLSRWTARGYLAGSRIQCHDIETEPSASLPAVLGNLFLVAARTSGALSLEGLFAGDAQAITVIFVLNMIALFYVATGFRLHFASFITGVRVYSRKAVRRRWFWVSAGCASLTLYSVASPMLGGRAN